MAIRQRFEPISLCECLPKLTATVVAVVSVEVDADRVLTLGSPRACPGPRNTATVYSLVQVDPTTSKPTVSSEVCNSSAAVVVSVQVVEVLRRAISESKESC